MSPEMRLVMAIGGSGFMCHVSNSFFRSKMPTMDDVLKIALAGPLPARLPAVVPDVQESGDAITH